MSKAPAGRLVLCVFAGSALMSCIQPAAPLRGQKQTSDQQVEQSREALNSSLPSRDNGEMVVPMKGHNQALQAAFRALERRGLLSPVLTSDSNQSLVHYGDYYADNVWAGRPSGLYSQNETPDTPTVADAILSANGTYSLLCNSAFDSTNWATDVPFVDATLDVDAKLRLKKGGVDLNKPTTYLQFVAKASLFSAANKSEEYTFSADNLYHYTFQEVQDMPGISQDEKDLNQNLQLYPLSGNDCKEGISFGIADSVAWRLRHQGLVVGADRGVVKYGAILYQLARKFFRNSCYQPSLSELVPAGNDVPGFHVGRVEGNRMFSELRMGFPHTKLGGMPYICSGPINPTEWPHPMDMCDDGLATWPVWLPDDESYNSYLTWEENIAALSTLKPGLSDRVALIYLGWAAHMIQDAATPHHAANWTGKEHERQDKAGDTPWMWERHEYGDCGNGQLERVGCDPNYSTCKCNVQTPFDPPLMLSIVELLVNGEVDALLGPVSNPKTRDEICSALGIADSQLMNGELNHSPVEPVFLQTATQAFRTKRTEIDNEGFVIDYLGDAFVSTIKLLLCAPPAQGASCPAKGGDFLDQGLIAGTHQRYPWDFNIFVFGDAMGLDDVGGPVATKGTVKLDSFSLNAHSTNPVSLIRGGSHVLQMSNGAIYGDIFVGGALGSDPDGAIYHTVSRNGAHIKTGIPFNFDDVQAKLRALSQHLMNFPPTGTTSPNESGVLFKGDLPGVNVFSVSGAALSGYRSFEFQIPAGATAIVNVVNNVPSNIPVHFNNASVNLNGADHRRILWNFTGANRIFASYIAFPGSLLAPDAPVQCSTGVFNGTLFAASLADSGMAFRWAPFRGDFPACGGFPAPSLTALPGEGKVELSWDAVEGATSYLVQRYSPNGGRATEKTIAEVTDGTTYTDFTVIGRTNYGYRVVAVNGFCKSQTGHWHGVTPAFCLSAPQLEAFPGDGKVLLSWTAIPNASSYVVEKLVNGEFQEVATTNGSTTTYTDTDKTNETTYYYAVRANITSWSSGPPAGYHTCSSGRSNQVTATPTSCLPAPSLNANAGDGKVVLSWTAVPGAMSYILERRRWDPRIASSISDFRIISQTDATTYTDSEVINGQSYAYAVNASSGYCCSARSNERVVTPSASSQGCTPPAAPSGLTASAGDGTITLTWSAATDATIYEILRSTTSGSGYASVGTSPSTNFTDNDSGLQDGNTYYYVVRALKGDSSCASANSTEASVKLEGCQVLGAGQTSIVLGTTSATCFKTCWQLLQGTWGCSSFTSSTRSLTVNGKSVNCGDAVGEKVDGGYAFNIGAGGNDWDAINWWSNGQNTAGTCP